MVSSQLRYAAPHIWPERLLKRFVPLGPEGAAAANWLQSVRRASLHRTVLHHALCCLPLNDFDVNAWLDIYPLHLLTRKQIGVFMAAGGVPTPCRRALDIGAGAGYVTTELAPYCDRLVVTETSRGMARHLKEMGFEVWHEDVTHTRRDRAATFPLVSIFNVLDRCAEPKRLINAAHSLLEPSSWLLLATPLPFRPAYFGWRTFWSGRPLERLGFSDFKDGSTSEEQERVWASHSQELLEDILPECGFDPVVVSRVPYLCGGDAFAPVSELDDIVVLARRL